jgi:hypothetical protein
MASRADMSDAVTCRLLVSACLPGYLLERYGPGERRRRFSLIARWRFDDPSGCLRSVVGIDGWSILMHRDGRLHAAYVSERDFGYDVRLKCE